jgi:hypothetical protein
MPDTQTLPQRVRAKYPGVYDDLSDAQLDTAVRAKYPGVYDDLPKPPADFSATNEKDASGNATLTGRALTTAKDVGVGALKGAAGIPVLFGRLAELVPGLPEAVDRLYGVPGISKNAFITIRHHLESTNAAQTVGKVAEQVAETIVPAGKIAKLGEVAAARFAPTLAPLVGKTAARLIPKATVEGAGNAALSAAQGGDARIGAVTGVAAPAFGVALESAPAALREQATKKVIQALGPTKERFKAIAARLVPEIQKRGLGGGREVLQQKAAGMLEAVGDQLDAALQQFGTQKVGTGPVVTALETAKDAFRTTAASGAVVAFEPRAIRQLEGLQKIVTDLGPDATVEQLVAVRRAWDKVVDQAGGFAHRAGGAIGVPLKDQSEAWAKREATGAIRDLLATEVPDLAAINKEWSFWKNLNDVLTQTLQRTQPHGVGVGRMMAEGAGQVVGGAVGVTQGAATGVGGAFALGKVAALAQKVFTSPRWRFVDAKLRNSLADAIANDRVGQATSLLVRISGIQASKVGGE